MANKPTRKMVPKQIGKPSAKEMLPKKTKPSMADMAKNRPASKNDMKNKKKSGPKSWNNGYTN
jgi:hypothetical protein